MRNYPLPIWKERFLKLMMEKSTFIVDWQKSGFKCRKYLQTSIQRIKLNNPHLSISTKTLGTNDIIVTIKAK